MYSLTPGYRIPALQRGLSEAENMATKLTAGVGSVAMLSAMITPPPIWVLGAVGTSAALINLSPGPRSVARWAGVGYRYLRERTPPESITTQPDGTATWVLYPDHGTLHDQHQRAAFHVAVAKALNFAGSQARNAGIQVHVTHHAAVGESTQHTQTISVHVPRPLTAQPERIIDTLAGEFAQLGYLMPANPEPAPAVAERSPAYVGLDDGRYAATARVTSWPDETDGDLMSKTLLGNRNQDGSLADCDRSFSVLYRPLPAGQSRRAAKWQRAASEAFTTDQVKADAQALSSDSTHGALVDGATLVDVDAYMTVWGDSSEAVSDARWHASLVSDRQRIGLDWLPCQQHRAHLMTTPYGAHTRKGAIL